MTIDHDVYSTLDVRPLTSDAQRERGRAGLAEFERRVFGQKSGALSGIRTLGVRMSEAFRVKGGLTLIGEVVDSAEDLAAAARVLRDPRFETFRVFFVRDNAIIAESVYSNRLPGCVYFPEEWLEAVARDKALCGADGYWCLHNHPSGRPDPSDADMRLTSDLSRKVGGFLGHVIIDHVAYCTLMPLAAPGALDVTRVDAEWMSQIDLRANPLVHHPLLDEALGGPVDLVRMAKALQIDGAHAVLIGTDIQYRIAYVAEVPVEVLVSERDSEYAKRRVAAQARRYIRESGAGGAMFLVVPDDAHAQKYAAARRSGLFRDIVDVQGNSLANSFEIAPVRQAAGRLIQERHGLDGYAPAPASSAATVKWPLRFEDKLRGAHHEQTDHTLRAVDAGGLPVGRIDYSVYQGIPAMQMISVPEPLRRQGIATAMVKELQVRFPGVEILWGGLSSDGAAFRAALPVIEKPSAVAPLFDRLMLARAERDALIALAKEADGLSVDKAAALDRLMDSINALHDTISALEYGVRGESPTLRLIDVRDHHQLADEVAEVEGGYAPPLWYSPLLRCVSGVNLPAMPAEQWQAWLRANGPRHGVKNEELIWTGTMEWLGQQGAARVTRDALLDYVLDHSVQLKEIQLCDAAVPRRPLDVLVDRLNERFAEYGYLVECDHDESLDFVDPDGEYIKFEELPPILQDIAIHEHPSDEAGIALRSDGAPFYREYVVPGGQQYRELLLIYRDADMQRREAIDKHFRDTASFPSPEDREFWMANGPGCVPGESNQYYSPHWQHANVIAHIRLDSRVDAEGKRVLFVHELQSDWGQSGKKNGFRSRDFCPADEVARRVGESKVAVAKDGYWEVRTVAGEFVSNVMSHDGFTTPELAIVEANRRIATKESSRLSVDNRVPAGPFVAESRAWLALAIKRVISFAAENDFDRVAIISGEQAAALYDLSRHVDTIIAHRSGKDEWTVEVWPVGKGEDAARVEIINDPMLDDVVGKELAKTIRADDGGRYSGLDLKVGGEGMRVFYDQIVPSVAKEVLRKLGGTGLGATMVAVSDATGLLADTVSCQFSFDITDTIRAATRHGMALFEPAVAYRTTAEPIDDPSP